MTTSEKASSEPTELVELEIPDAQVRGVLSVLDRVLGECYSQLDGYPGWQDVIAHIGMAIAEGMEDET